MAPTITPYDFSNITNSSGNKLNAFLQYTSASTNYVPGLVILLIVFSVLFLILKAKGASVMGAFTSATVVNFVLALLLYPIGLISGQILVVSILLIPIAGFLLYVTGG